MLYKPGDRILVKILGFHSGIIPAVVVRLDNNDNIIPYFVDFEDVVLNFHLNRWVREKSIVGYDIKQLIREVLDEV